ncbi:MAG: stage V sporulation protein AC [Peptococcaceae bacterium]
MELHLEHNLQNREKRLQKLQELDQANMEQLLLELQQEHQQLVSMEAGSIDLTEQRYYQELIEQNREQTLRIQKEIDKEYQKQISLVTPKAPVLKNVLRAFLVGGAICLLGQLVINFMMLTYDADFKSASALASITIVVITAVLTGIGVYDEIGRYGGAGSMVPISGFANSVVSAALEFKREGMIYGIGAKIFTIAGPVILYGTVASVVIGMIYYLLG